MEHFKTFESFLSENYDLVSGFKGEDPAGIPKEKI